VKSSQKNKKIVFDDTANRHAKLKIRLRHDNLTQAEFFRAFITAYIEKDPLIMQFIHNYKEHYKVQSKRSQKIIKKDLLDGQSKIEQFGLIEDELEDIFDLIASEHPDL
tara:strand:+ start:5313 stop:5639 length:327 start_codon:yes stop_codon:yes gene_type:complete